MVRADMMFGSESMRNTRVKKTEICVRHIGKLFRNKVTNLDQVLFQA